MKDWEKQQYSKLVNKVLQEGEKRPSRAGDVYSIFGESLTIDMSTEFPLLRGRKMFYSGIFGELAAMLRGPRNVSDFKRFGCNYWDAWGKAKRVNDADETIVEQGELTLDYGNAWLDFNGVNQLDQLVKTLQNNPNDRRMLVSAWRPDRLSDLSLPCCHYSYQWYVRNGKYLDMLWNQRSADVMVGIPSDIVLAATWNAILAAQCGYEPGIIRMVFGDTHIYANHVGPTLDYMRQLRNYHEATPIEYKIHPGVTLENFEPGHLEIKNYRPAPAIKFELNV